MSRRARTVGVPFCAALFYTTVIAVHVLINILSNTRSTDTTSVIVVVW